MSILTLAESKVVLLSVSCPCWRSFCKVERRVSLLITLAFLLGEMLPYRPTGAVHLERFLFPSLRIFSRFYPVNYAQRFFWRMSYVMRGVVEREGGHMRILPVGKILVTQYAISRCKEPRVRATS